MGVTVGFLGLGIMGTAMSRNCLKAGHDVMVWNRSPRPAEVLAAEGARVAATPAEAAAYGEVVIVMLTGPEACQAVLFGPHGAAAVMRPGQTVMLCPTIAPQDAEALATGLAARGIGCIDAPMSGGPARARDGSMSLMLAAPAGLLQAHEAVLAALSSRRFVISERIGDGARTKLVNNLLAGINLVGAAEVLALAERLGLDLGTTLDVIEQSSGQSWIGSDRMRRAIEGDLAPRAHVTLLEKDTRLALEAARQAGFEGPLGARASAVFAQARAAGLADWDDAALLDLLRAPPPR